MNIKSRLCRLVTEGTGWDLNWLGLILSVLFIIKVGKDERCYKWRWER